ncbi:MAG: DUF2062 domain-containing protein [Pseudomonadota bacterium]
MVFKRRDRRSVWKAILDFLYPRGGWARAFEYVKHRVRRLPDTPEKIARGIWAGVFAAFTPFYGLHFFVAAFLAFIMRGNILASLMGTFFGNPLTYVPIGVVALSFGDWILGTNAAERASERSFGGKFVDAGWDLWHNFTAIFTHEEVDWTGLSVFYDEIFFPYMIGGLIPGVVTATIVYYLSVPVIRAYQKRRKGRLTAKLAELKKKAIKKADASNSAD